MVIKRFNEFPEGSGSLTNDDIFLFMDSPSGLEVTKKVSLNQMSLAMGSVTSVNTPSASSFIQIQNIIKISQADYDNIVTKNPNTLYVIT
jgi:hypothetical protein